MAHMAHGWGLSAHAPSHHSLPATAHQQATGGNPSSLLLMAQSIGTARRLVGASGGACGYGFVALLLLIFSVGWVLVLASLPVWVCGALRFLYSPGGASRLQGAIVNLAIFSVLSAVIFAGKRVTSEILMVRFMHKAQERVQGVIEAEERGAQQLSPELQRQHSMDLQQRHAGVADLVRALRSVKRVVFVHLPASLSSTAVFATATAITYVNSTMVGHAALTCVALATLTHLADDWFERRRMVAILDVAEHGGVGAGEGSKGEGSGEADDGLRLAQVASVASKTSWWRMLVQAADGLVVFVAPVWILYVGLEESRTQSIDSTITAIAVASAVYALFTAYVGHHATRAAIASYGALACVSRFDAATGAFNGTDRKASMPLNGSSSSSAENAGGIEMAATKREELEDQKVEVIGGSNDSNGFGNTRDGRGGDTLSHRHACRQLGCVGFLLVVFGAGIVLAGTVIFATTMSAVSTMNACAAVPIQCKIAPDTSGLRVVTQEPQAFDFVTGCRFVRKPSEIVKTCAVRIRDSNKGAGDDDTNSTVRSESEVLFDGSGLDVTVTATWNDWKSNPES